MAREGMSYNARQLALQDSMKREEAASGEMKALERAIEFLQEHG